MDTSSIFAGAALLGVLGCARKPQAADPVIAPAPPVAAQGTGHAEPARPSWLSEAHYPFQSRWREVLGHRVHYVDEGQGPVLLFVHGNPDWSFLYRDVIEDLRAGFRCVAIDLPGFGLSREAQGYRYTPREHAAVVRQFISDLDLRDYTLVLHDWGGPIGLHAAAAEPDRVAGLVLGGTHAFADFHRTRPAGEWMMMRLMTSRRGRRWVEDHNVLLQGVLDREMKKGRSGEVPADVRAAYEGPFDTRERRLATFVFATHNYRDVGVPFLEEVERSLPRLADRPVLFVWGGADKYTTTKRELKRLRTAFPEHAVAIYEGHGHFFPETAGGQMAASIRGWHPGE